MAPESAHRCRRPATDDVNSVTFDRCAGLYGGFFELHDDGIVVYTGLLPIVRTPCSTTSGTFAAANVAFGSAMSFGAVQSLRI